jgi:branched-chain amino acid transport system permease protein
MLQYVLAGLALGSIYAIASAGLVITYASAGILNFAFGSMAFFIALFYYWLHEQHNWGILPSALLSIVVVGAALGAALWAVLFRVLRDRAPLIKVVATIGLSVALPPAAFLLFGDSPISQAAGLAPEPVKVFHPFGAAVTLDQIIIYACLLVIVIAGTVALRVTDVGLRVRAMVDSTALTSLSGTSPARIAVGVWSVSAALAGLAGVLVAPTQGLTVDGMTALMASAFAAVVAARLRSLPVAVIVSLVMGVVTDLVQEFLPAGSSLTANIVPSIPFGFILLFLLYYVIRTGRVSETATGAGVLDKAIAVVSAGRGIAHAMAPARTAGRRFSLWQVAPVVPLIVIAFFPVIFSGFWLNLVAEGLALALILLSYTIVTGEGGMIWLCQITFAGGGAVAGAQLATVAHWPPLAAAIAGGLLMVPIGVLIGALTIRLGDLYVALVTLSFGLLCDTLIFTLNRFYQAGIGVTFYRPGFAQSDQAFSYLTLIVFAIIAVAILNLRRSTTGLAVSAVRWSEPGSRTLGLSVVQTKILLTALSTFVAGLGGAFLAMWNGSTLPTSYSTFEGLIWLAVLVTIGVRSITAAAIAGLLFTLLPNVFTTYLPSSQDWSNVPALLFGLGAIGVAANPDGVVAMHARQIQTLISRLIRSRGADETGTTGVPPGLAAVPTPPQKQAPTSAAPAKQPPAKEAQKR